MSTIQQHETHPLEHETMGGIVVDLLVANHQDMVMFKAGALRGHDVRQMPLRGVIDTGANWLVLPTAVAERLGLPRVADAVVRYSDGRRGTVGTVELVELELLGRRGAYRALLEPDRTTALVGAIVMEDLDLLVDPKNQRIYPRDPERLTSDI
jgi:predicted aspartyl protease